LDNFRHGASPQPIGHGWLAILENIGPSEGIQKLVHAAGGYRHFGDVERGSPVELFEHI
jgi:hypothetical protein